MSKGDKRLDKLYPALTAREHRNGADEDDTPTWNEVGELLATRLRDGVQLCWSELRAAEMVLEEARAHFDGENPALPRLRGMLEEGKGKVQEVYKGVQELVGEFELAEPDEELLAETRMLVEQARKTGG